MLLPPCALAGRGPMENGGAIGAGVGLGAVALEAVAVADFALEADI